MICFKGSWGSCPRCGSMLENIGRDAYGGPGAVDQVRLMCPNHGTNYDRPAPRKKKGRK